MLPQVKVVAGKKFTWKHNIQKKRPQLETRRKKLCWLLNRKSILE